MPFFKWQSQKQLMAVQNHFYFSQNTEIKFQFFNKNDSNRTKVSLLFEILPQPGFISQIFFGVGIVVYHIKVLAKVWFQVSRSSPGSPYLKFWYWWVGLQWLLWLRMLRCAFFYTEIILKYLMLSKRWLDMLWIVARLGFQK